MHFDDLRRYPPPFGSKAAKSRFGHFASLYPRFQ
jgi:hypothetical protein